MMELRVPIVDIMLNTSNNISKSQTLDLEEVCQNKPPLTNNNLSHRIRRQPRRSRIDSGKILGNSISNGTNIKSVKNMTNDEAEWLRASKKRTISTVIFF